jgi:hypothetical protein
MEVARGEFRMSFRCIRMLPLLIMGFALSSYAQSAAAPSLADIARQTRAQVQQSPNHPRVITNEDLDLPPVAPPAKGDDSAAADKNDEADGKAAAKDGDKQDAKPEAKKSTKPDPEKLRQQQEAETEKRTQEINRQYLDRIAAIKDKINSAQQNLARLQRDQTESTIAFQRGVGTNPTIADYQQQQRLLGDQIDAQRQNITDLNSELEDAQESARHAGVPHTD